MKPKERDPDKVWLGDTEWYLDLTDYTLTHDGEQLATVNPVDKSVLLRTVLVQIGDKTPEKLVGHRKGVNKLQWPTVTTLRFSPDGTMLASAGADDRIVVWDVQTRKPKHVLQPRGAIWTVAWGSHSKRLASAGTRGLIRIWEFDSRQKPVYKDIPLHVVEQVLGQVSTLSFFPSGSRLLAAGTDYLPVPTKGFVRIFDVGSGDKLCEIVKPEITFMCAEVSPDGKTVAIGADKEVLLWTPPNAGDDADAR